MRLKDLSPYQLALLVIYLGALPFLFLFSFSHLAYHFSVENIMVTLGVALISAILFSLSAPLIGLGHVKLRFLTASEAARTLLYALLIAIPEEIFFRGVVQSFLTTAFEHSVLPVLFSSFIFSVAHLPNGARGWRIGKWNWDFFHLSFMGGLLLGTLYSVTGELLSPILLHALFLFGLRSFRTPAKT